MCEWVPVNYKKYCIHTTPQNQKLSLVLTKAVAQALNLADARPRTAPIDFSKILDLAELNKP